MNAKKFLKKKAQEDLESVQTDSDREVLMRLKNSVTKEAPKKRRNLKWLWAVSSGAVACAVAAILIVELVPFPSNDIGETVPPSDSIKYEDANFVQELSDFSEVSNALSNLTLHLTENQVVDVVKTSDSVSGDELYYVLNIDESSMDAVYSMRLLIVVNDNYDYDKFSMEGEVFNRTYPDYTISYTQKIITDPDIGLNTIAGGAKIENAKYEMYVLQYQEYSFEDGIILTVINNMLDFHD